MGRPHLPLRLLRFEEQWFVERCSRWSSVQVFGCVADSHFVTELDIDENADGNADLRTYLWDKFQPRECEERREERWQTVAIAECCCRAGCSAETVKQLDAGCPLALTP